MAELKEKALQRGLSQQSGGNSESTGSYRTTTRTGLNSDDSRASLTIQSKVLRYLASEYDRYGERLARGNGWVFHAISKNIAVKTGISQRQAIDALYRLKHRRHIVWYQVVRGKIFQIVIPEHWYWRRANER